MVAVERLTDMEVDPLQVLRDVDALLTLHRKIVCARSAHRCLQVHTCQGSDYDPCTCLHSTRAIGSV